MRADVSCIDSLFHYCSYLFDRRVYCFSDFTIVFAKLVVVLFTLSWFSAVCEHYVWLSIDNTPKFDVVRRPDNYVSREPIGNVNDSRFRCYTSTGTKAPNTYTVNAGQTITFHADANLYHIGVVNVYMAKAPSKASDFDGAGKVWFRIFEITPLIDPSGKSAPTYPVTTMNSISFTIPKNLPGGEYLVRIEKIALHISNAPEYLIGCAQIAVKNGGHGTPGSLIAIPGVYTGNEPGLRFEPYWPVPTKYQQPGPAIWRG